MYSKKNTYIMASALSWRQVYVVSIILRFIFGLSDSYIHPDEHFQSFEVLTNQFFGFNTNSPWEFVSDSPARSYGPLYLFYGPLFLFLKYFQVPISPKGIWYLARVQLIVVSWLTTDMCLYRLLPTKPERVKAVFFTSTSYITLVYQSHCFSNSLETPILIACLWIISDMRFDIEVRDFASCDYAKLFYLGVLVAIGIFNRITFVAFILVPAYFIAKYLWKFKLGSLVIAAGFLLTTVSMILIDTAQFKGFISYSWDYKDYVITPLNSLLYNTNSENLKLHGLHPYYTHLLVNLPQILGPLLIVFFYGGRNSYYRTVPFLSFASGIVVLSLVPHQELRFLIPLLPVACCCLDFNKINGEEVENEEIKQKISSKSTNLKPEKVYSLRSHLVNILIYLWYIFNAIMAVIMGMYHQGGVVPALDFTHVEFVKQNQKFVQVWWRTYSPPSWLLGSSKSTTMQITDFDALTIEDFDHVLIDAMGSDLSSVNDVLNQLKGSDHKVMFVAPVASMNCDFDTQNFDLKEMWKTHFHLDLDHLNFDSLACLSPGLAIYELV